ncbi:MAG: DUF4349 domain-containing protein [Prevotellaceae bacterium]|jgi:CxxC motif-containing protein|nr:DUF4349 domain-containing protein [Prevotellaceae bacterium]
MKKIFIFLALNLVLFGCNNGRLYDKSVATEAYDMEVAADEDGAFADNKMLSIESQQIVNKKIIKTGSVKIQSDNVQKSRQALDAILNETKSYIQKEEFFNGNNREVIDLTIRVPNQFFDLLINSLYDNGIGVITRKEISSKDVTEDYYDTEIRLKNKELYLAKYRDFLAKAKTTTEMLDVQEKIRNMEEEIESAKGKLRFIDDRVNFSTLEISIYKEKPAISGGSEVGFLGRLWASIVNGWNLLAEIFFGILQIWSILLIIGVVVWGGFKIRKVRKNKK